MSEPIYHKHHVIPRHAGGTNDPSNIIRITVEEHAEAHRMLWEKNGKLEDKLAWLLLSRQTSEGVLVANQLSVAVTKGVPLTAEHRKKLSDAKRGKHLTTEHRKNISGAKRGKQRAPFTIAHKANMSRNHRKYQSDEAKAKIRSFHDNRRKLLDRG